MSSPGTSAPASLLPRGRAPDPAALFALLWHRCHTDREAVVPLETRQMLFARRTE